MNLKEEKYSKFYLVQEMMGTVDTVRRFDPADSDFVADAAARTGRILFSGEGSSRILPAKNAGRKAKRWGLALNVQTEGSHQACEYDLSGYTVLLASNSGRTKETLLLANYLKDSGNPLRFGLTANENTPLEATCVKTHRLKCGWENAVAATKSVVEQALFCESIMWKAADKDMKPWLASLPAKLEEALTMQIPADVVEKIKGAKTIYFAGMNDGVAEELTLKTNEITRRKSDFLEGTYALHGVEEVMEDGDVVIVINPIETEYAKYQTVFSNARVNVVAIDTKPTPFETIIVPEAGEMQPYVYLCAGWNILVETAVSDGINLDKPERARKVGNEM